jgi:predicted kinase
MSQPLLDTATHLASDLAWLERYAHERPELEAAVVPLRLAAALLRNHVGPLLANRPALPLHIAVVGGAGTGKSTVANFLIGRAIAEANPQAGFTRHPVAYVAAGSEHAAQVQQGILGPLKSIPGPVSSDRDEDVYQVRQVGQVQPENEPLQLAVVWDCPDMTTWKANQYQTRLVETIGLADLVIYVASDERYNDAWPTQYLQYMLQAGKPVIAVLTKMQPDQREPLLKHFREHVIARIPECSGVSAVVALPTLTAAEQADPAGAAVEHRSRLLEPINWWLKKPHKTRHESATRAVRFLNQFQETLLAPARHDLNAIAQWRRWVDEGQVTFEQRYQNEQLSGEQFPQFSAAMLRLMELLELPGVGQYVSKAMHVLRTPYRWVKSWVKKPDAVAVSMQQVITAGYQGWRDRLRRELLAQNGDQPVWKALRQAFQTAPLSRSGEAPGVKAGSTDGFDQRLAAFMDAQAQESETIARAIYQELEKNPTALNTLRGLKFSVEAASLTGVIVTAGTHLLLDAVLVPVVASLTQAVTEALGKQYIDSQREKARVHLLAMFQETLSRPLATDLREWPSQLVPTLPQLEQIVERVPASLKTLQAALEQAEKEAA